MNHAFNGGPLLQEAAAQEPQRDKAKEEALRRNARENGFWLN